MYIRYVYIYTHYNLILYDIIWYNIISYDTCMILYCIVLYCIVYSYTYMYIYDAIILASKAGSMETLEIIGMLLPALRFFCPRIPFFLLLGTLLGTRSRLTSAQLYWTSCWILSLVETKLGKKTSRRCHISIHIVYTVKCSGVLLQDAQHHFGMQWDHCVRPAKK